MDNPLLLKFVTVTIFCSMLSIGVNHSIRQLTSLWRQTDLLLRSLVAVIMVVPLLVGLLLWAFDLPVAVATGLALLASAPGAPLTTKRGQMAGGDPVYSASLQLTLALTAVIVSPVTLAAFYALFEFPTERVTPFKVATQVAEVTFLPVLFGLLLQRLAPGFTARISKPVRLVADVLLLLLVVGLVGFFVLKPELMFMLNLGVVSTAAIAITVGGSLVMGHLLGGPSRAQRSSLAIASIARNAGLALFIAAFCGYGPPFVPTLLAYLLVGAVVAAPYSIWSKRSMTGKDNQ